MDELWVQLILAAMTLCILPIIYRIRESTLHQRRELSAKKIQAAWLSSSLYSHRAYQLLSGDYWDTEEIHRAKRFEFTDRTKYDIWMRRFSKMNKTKLIDELKRLGSLCLTQNEKLFLERFYQQKFFLAHRTNDLSFAQISKNRKILSAHELRQRQLSFQSHSEDGDEAKLHNEDFIFFSLEVGQNELVRTSRYGNKVIRLNFKSLSNINRGWLSLTEQLDPSVPNINVSYYPAAQFNWENMNLRHEIPTSMTTQLGNLRYSTRRSAQYEPRTPKNQDFAAINYYPQNQCTSYKTEGIIACDLSTSFYGADMLPCVGLAIITELRRISDHRFSQKALKTHTEEGFNNLLKTLFRIEVKLPRQVFL